MQTVLSIIILLVSIVITITVASMESEQAGLGTLDGSVDSLWGEHTGQSKKEKLNKIVTYSSIVFIVSLLVLLAIQ